MRKALFFLGIMNDADIEWLSDAGERIRVSAGTVLIREGRPIDNLFVVLEGCLMVTTAASGSRPVARLRSGEIIGEISFADARPPSATVTAEQDSVVLAVPRKTLELKLQDPPFAARFYRALSVFLADRLRQTTSQLGYGTPRENDSTDPATEIDPQLLEQTSLAGARFDWLLKRLRGA
jgi:CRP-like cAMP-binding protein